MRTNKILSDSAWKDYNEGELLAYNEILQDIKLMNDKEFINKYLEIVGEVSRKFDNEEIIDENKIEKVSEYNNAIVFVLSCINPIYKYDIEEESYEME